MKKAFVIVSSILFLAACSADSSSAGNHGEHSGPLMNYHRIDERLVTGGHLVNDGLDTLKAEGVTVVIDLREEPPRGQKEKLAEQGIEWINVPVEWGAPENEDFERFSEVMQAHRDDHVLVQCAANYRASAMTYLYRVVVEQVDEETAGKDLYAVWDPGEVSREWEKYIDGILTAW